MRLTRLTVPLSSGSGRTGHEPAMPPSLAAALARRRRPVTVRPTVAAAGRPPESYGCARRALLWRVAVIAELAVLVVLVSAVVAAPDAYAETTRVLALVGSVDEVLTNIRNWIMGILASLATVFLSIGGVRYVMGGGDPGEIEKAKTAFKAAGIGYGLAALAPVIVTVLKSIVGA